MYNMAKSPNACSTTETHTSWPNHVNKHQGEKKNLLEKRYYTGKMKPCGSFHRNYVELIILFQ